MKQKLLSEKIELNIIQLIQEDIYCSGDKFPNEIDLADELNVSRSTIREAIKALETKNILTIRRGIGTFVSETPGLIEEPYGLKFIKSKNTKLELAQVILSTRNLILDTIKSNPLKIYALNDIVDLKIVSEDIINTKEKYYYAIESINEINASITNSTYSRIIMTLFSSYRGVSESNIGFNSDKFRIEIRNLNEAILNRNIEEFCLHYEELINLVLV